MPDDHSDQDVRGRPAQFEVMLHWVKERELPAVDDEFAQQVGEYTDVAGLRAAIEGQLRQREEERARGELEEAAVSRLIEISSIEYPPQLVDHQAQHMLESFQRNIEQQGLQLQQYLRLVGKDQEALQQEIRAEADSRVRRTLALDAFATAEQISVEREEVEDEFRRASGDAGLSELAMSDPTNLQRMHDFTRERKAMSRLVELATTNGHRGSAAANPAPVGEMPAPAAATTDTEPSTASVEEQERGAE
jgi:trigger factor